MNNPPVPAAAPAAHTSIVPAQQAENGGALAALTVQQVRANVDAIKNLMKSVMRKDTHYGVIPGTGDKPTLLKPGAELISMMFRLTPSFDRQVTWDGPHMTVFSECTLTHQPTGAIIARAGALCTTKETRYAYRQATRKCPKCTKPAIIKGSDKFGGGWVCWKKKDGCGAHFKDDDPTITGQAAGREENPNITDTYNTVLKIADKRAYVASTLFGTAASEVYTQDVEDFAGNRDEPPAEEAAPPPPADEYTDIVMGSDEFEGHLRDMAEAFARNEGPEWWNANARAIKAGCSEEQWARLEQNKNEMKDYAKQHTAQAGGAAPSPQPAAPAGGAPDAASGGGAPSAGNPDPAASDSPATATRGKYLDLRKSLEAAHKANTTQAWWQEHGEDVRKLNAAEQEAINVYDDELMEAKRNRRTKK